MSAETQSKAKVADRLEINQTSDGCTVNVPRLCSSCISLPNLACSRNRQHIELLEYNSPPPMDAEMQKYNLVVAIYQIPPAKSPDIVVMPKPEAQLSETSHIVSSTELLDEKSLPPPLSDAHTAPDASPIIVGMSHCVH